MPLVFKAGWVEGLGAAGAGAVFEYAADAGGGKRARAARLDAEVFAQRSRDGVGIRVEADGAQFVDRFGRQIRERLPRAGAVLRLEAHGVHRAPVARGRVEFIHQIDGEQLVRDGEIEADEFHRLRARERGGELRGQHVEREVTPVQAERGQCGIVHRGRGGMLHRMPINRAKARAGAEFSRCGHAADSRSSRFKVQSSKCVAWACGGEVFLGGQAGFRESRVVVSFQTSGGERSGASAARR